MNGSWGYIAAQQTVPYADVTVGFPEEFESDASHYCTAEVLSGVAGSNSVIILTKGDVKDPMQFVFDVPMATQNRKRGLGAEMFFSR